MAWEPAWVRRLMASGAEPDPRFTFANERTFLAWVRTSLALVAAGVGVDAFATDIPDAGRRALAALLIVLGGGLSTLAFRRWYRSEEALRTQAPLPANQFASVIAYGLTLGAALALALVIVS